MLQNRTFNNAQGKNSHHKQIRGDCDTKPLSQRDDLFWVYIYLQVSSQKFLSITGKTLMLYL